MTKFKLGLGAICIATVLAGSLALAVPASASSARATAESRPLARTLRHGMSFVPILRILGAAPGRPGYFRVLAANGREAIIPDSLKGAVSRRIEYNRRHPNSVTDTVYGNCGSSFITLTTKSNGDPITTLTGFTVIAPEVNYYWVSGRSGPSYPAYTTSWQSFTSSNSKTITWNSVGNYPHGTWSGATSTSSYVVFQDGSMEGQICYSGGPAVSGHV